MAPATARVQGIDTGADRSPGQAPGPQIQAPGLSYPQGVQTNPANRPQGLPFGPYGPPAPWGRFHYRQPIPRP